MIGCRGWRYRVALGLLLAGAAAAAIAAEEVPFVTTPDRVTLAMLQIAKVGPIDRVIDLGSGDGRIVIMAAQRFGARGLGVEIVPDLVRRSIENARRAGVARRVEFREQDLFTTDLTGATVVTMYLLPEVNLKLRPKLLELKPGTRIVSHDWDMGDWRPDRTLNIAVPEKAIGREKTSRVHLWVVPARVDGVWCVSGRRGGESLRITQNFQTFRAELHGAAGASIAGRIRANRLHSSEPSTDALHLVLIGERLRVTRGRGAFVGLQGKVLTRGTDAPCAGRG
jgi:SAM-dependent methyltransferase